MQLGASQTRPDIAFEVCKLTMKCRNAKVATVASHRSYQNYQVKLQYSQFSNPVSLVDLKLLVFSDAS